MLKLFVSYSDQDREFVERLAADVQRIGIEVTIFRWAFDVGEPMWEEIEGWIGEADFQLQLLTHAATSSDAVMRELEVAKAKEEGMDRSFILPLKLEQVDVSPLSLSDRWYASFTSEYEGGLTDLLDKLFKHMPENAWLFQSEQVNDGSIAQILNQLAQSKGYQQAVLERRIRDNLERVLSKWTGLAGNLMNSHPYARLLKETFEDFNITVANNVRPWSQCFKDEVEAQLAGKLDGELLHEPFGASFQVVDATEYFPALVFWVDFRITKSGKPYIATYSWRYKSNLDEELLAKSFSVSKLRKGLQHSNEGQIAYYIGSGLALFFSVVQETLRDKY